MSKAEKETTTRKTIEQAKKEISDGKLRETKEIHFKADLFVSASVVFTTISILISLFLFPNQETSVNEFLIYCAKFLIPTFIMVFVLSKATDKHHDKANAIDEKITNDTLRKFDIPHESYLYLPFFIGDIVAVKGLSKFEEHRKYIVDDIDYDACVVKTQEGLLFKMSEIDLS